VTCACRKPVAALGSGESATVSCVAEPAQTQEIVATATGHGVNGDDVPGTADRNIGDVPMTVAVANDTAPNCDFELTGEGLRAGAHEHRDLQR